MVSAPGRACTRTRLRSTVPPSPLVRASDSARAPSRAAARCWLTVAADRRSASAGRRGYEQTGPAISKEHDELGLLSTPSALGSGLVPGRRT